MPDIQHPLPDAAASRRAVLVSVHDPSVPSAEVERSAAELTALAAGIGIEVVASIIQKRRPGMGTTYLGRGKLRELASMTGGTGRVHRGPPDIKVDEDDDDIAEELPEPIAELVLVDDEITPAQQRTLQAATDAPVMDRSAVILRVFESRANTRQARLEIEAARLAYELPRVREDHSLGDREGGGGRAARGHSNVELAKQRIRIRLAELKRELDAVQVGAANQRSRRADTPLCSLVGYTNAGKSTLMRQMTGSEVLVADQLFATLSTTVRQIEPPTTPPALLADTVGFIRRLPHELVASFRSTLSEARNSWLLVVVADASDPDLDNQIAVTREVLDQIGASQVPRIVVLNKIDRVEPHQRSVLASRYPDAIQLSAFDPAGIAALHERIGQFLDGLMITESFELTYQDLALLGELRSAIKVVAEEYGPSVSLKLKGLPETIGRFRKRLMAGT